MFRTASKAPQYWAVQRPARRRRLEFVIHRTLAYHPLFRSPVTHKLENRFSLCWISERADQKWPVPSFAHLFRRAYATAPAPDFKSLSTEEAITLINRSDALESSVSKDQEALVKRFCNEMLGRALNGDVRAQVALGTLLSRDHFHVFEAAMWFRKASEEHNHPFAQFALGVIYLTGATADVTLTRNETRPPYYIDIDHLESFLGSELGISPDGEVEKKFDFRKWLKAERNRLVKLKDASASEASFPVEHNPPLGLEYLERSAAQNYFDSIFYLLTVYSDPNRPFYDPTKAKTCLDRILTKASANVLYLVGVAAFETNSQGIFDNPHHYFAKAASTGHHQAQFWAGYMLHQGIGVPVDKSKGAELVMLAAATYKPAQFYLAQMYRTGDGVPQDSQTMMSWLLRSAEAPHPHNEALYVLGDVYFGGSDGQEVDYAKALAYFKEAGRHGNPDALCNVGVMYFNGIGTGVDHEKAFYAYQNGALYDHIQCMTNLADMYEQGLGVPQSLQSAQYYRAKVSELQSGSPSDKSTQTLFSMLTDTEELKPKE